MPYPDDGSRADVPRLLGSVWPSIPGAIEQARVWGSDWFEVSTPFVSREGDEVASHVGVVEVHLHIDGEDRSVGGIHAVCTHSSHRGRGHFRRAMEAALEEIDTRFRTAVVWTGEPAIYEGFGFRLKDQVVYRGPVESGREMGGEVRPLRADSTDDLKILARLLRERAPASRRCAARDPGWHFLINLAIWPEARQMLHYLPDLDCAVVAKREGDRLVIYDVLAARPPSLTTLTGRLAGDAASVELYLHPDRLGFETRLQAEPRPGDDLLLVRGEPLFPEGPVSLSPFIYT